GAITLLLLLMTSAIAQDIAAGKPDPRAFFLVGNAWRIFVNGEIKADIGERLEQFIASNKVPRESMVILNSPGGSLAGGMALGRVIRKYNLRTDVGIQKSPESTDYSVGECFSACTLAYVGGSFRWLRRGSSFGVHRFSFTTP